MKKIKFSLAFLAITLLSIGVHSAMLSGNDTPGAGLEVFNTIAFGILFIGVGLLLDIYFIFTKSTKAAIRNRKGFWQLIGGIVFIGIIYFVYYSLST